MRLDRTESHFSEKSPPCQVPRRLRHTFPSAYKLGLNLWGWGGVEGIRKEWRKAEKETTKKSESVQMTNMGDDDMMSLA